MALFEEQLRREMEPSIGGWAWKKFDNYIEQEKFRKQGMAGKAWDYYKIVKDLINGQTRTGGYMKLGIKVTMDIAGKALDFSPTSHPYFTYHKAHLKALADALDAQADSQAAIDAFNKAVKAADAANSAPDILSEYKKRTGFLGLQYASFIDALSLWHDLMAGGAAAGAAIQTIGRYGVQHGRDPGFGREPQSLAGQLARVVFRVAAAADHGGGGAGDRSRGDGPIQADHGEAGEGIEPGQGGGERDRTEHLLGAVRPDGQSQTETVREAILDPTVHAARMRDDVDTTSRALADMCSFVISTDARDKDKYTKQAAVLAGILDAV